MAVVKHGSRYGATVRVLDPDWEGMVKVDLARAWVMPAKRTALHATKDGFILILFKWVLVHRI